MVEYNPAPGKVREVGEVVDYAGAAAPTGWLLCYGQPISRTTYAALFAVCSTTYGAGDGSTTFNVPDARGRVIAGQDDMGGSSANRLTGLTGGVDGDALGASGGGETQTLDETQIPSHVHNNRTGTGSGGSTQRVTTISTYTGSAAGPDTQATGGGLAHNNVQPTLILNKIIFAGV